MVYFRIVFVNNFDVFVGPNFYEFHNQGPRNNSETATDACKQLGLYPGLKVAVGDAYTCLYNEGWSIAP